MDHIPMIFCQLLVFYIPPIACDVNAITTSWIFGNEACIGFVMHVSKSLAGDQTLNLL